MGDLLQELDHEISISDKYVKDKLLRIQTMENKLQSRGVSKEQQYDIYGELYNEYFPYNYVTAQDILESRKNLARESGDIGKLNDVLLDEALLNTTAGVYLQALGVLQDGIDTLTLTDYQYIKYLNVCQRFWYDYHEYMPDDPNAPQMLQRAFRYRKKLLDATPESSLLHQQITVLQCMDDKNLEQADFLNRNLLARMDSSSHDYALHAYYEGRINEELGKTEDMKAWFARSAMCDIRSATKDNASLFSLARQLFREGDVERAFTYTELSLNDALAYDARLRQWQIAAVLPEIQTAYTGNLRRQEARDKGFIAALSILMVLILVTATYTLNMYRLQRKNSRRISEMNTQIRKYSDSLEKINNELNGRNKELLEASAAKEEYIGLFLSMCSGYIDKFKSYESSVRKRLLAGEQDKIIKEAKAHETVDKELAEFYHVFDESFLRLYPKFVEQFNELLMPQFRVVLKEGELMNTQLRIFALIRLGITQSSRIASMLRYSVNTIYNYRAQTKNAAIGDREKFEDKVRKIGS